MVVPNYVFVSQILVIVNKVNYLMKQSKKEKKDNNKKKANKFDKILKVLLNTPPESNKKRNKNEIRKYNLLWR